MYVCLLGTKLVMEMTEFYLTAVQVTKVKHWL